MALAFFHASAAFASPTPMMMQPPVTRVAAPLMMSGGPTRKERKAAAEAGPEEVDQMEGVVVPTGGAVQDEATTGSKLPPLTGSPQAMAAELARRVAWNPQGLDVVSLPKPLQEQFVAE